MEKSVCRLVCLAPVPLNGPGSSLNANRVILDGDGYGEFTYQTGDTHETAGSDQSRGIRRCRWRLELSEFSAPRFTSPPPTNRTLCQFLTLPGTPVPCQPSSIISNSGRDISRETGVAASPSVFRTSKKRKLRILARVWRFSSCTKIPRGIPRFLILPSANESRGEDPVFTVRNRFSDGPEMQRRILRRLNYRGYSFDFNISRCQGKGR